MAHLAAAAAPEHGILPAKKVKIYFVNLFSKMSLSALLYRQKQPVKGLAVPAKL